MEHQNQNLKEYVENNKLDTSLQAIIYEMKEGLLTSNKAIEVIKEGKLDTEAEKKFLHLAHQQIERVMRTLNDVMIDVYLHKLRSELEKG